LSFKTKVDGLSVVWPQNHWDDLSVVWSQNHWNGFLRFGLKIGDDDFFWFDLRWFFSGLTSKSVTMISPELASKSVARISQFETQN
jgi:hypothetical protein